MKWKLYKQYLSPDNVVAPSRVLVMEANERDVLKKEANRLADCDGTKEHNWVWEGKNDTSYGELTVADKYRFVIRHD